MAATIHDPEKVWTEREKLEYARKCLQKRYQTQKDGLGSVAIDQIENQHMSAIITFPRTENAWLDYVAIQALTKQLEDDQEVGILI